MVADRTLADARATLTRDLGVWPAGEAMDLGPDPFWVCHRSGMPVAQVGQLHATG